MYRGGGFTVYFTARAGVWRRLTTTVVFQRAVLSGVINVAKACLEAKVPRLVVVSSGGVATPDSSIYKFLNLFGEVPYTVLTPIWHVSPLYQLGVPSGVQRRASTYVCF